MSSAPSAIIDLTLDSPSPPSQPVILPPPPPLEIRRTSSGPLTTAQSSNAPPSTATFDIPYIDLVDSDEEDNIPGSSLRREEEVTVKQEVSGDLRDLLPTALREMVRMIDQEEQAMQGDNLAAGSRAKQSTTTAPQSKNSTDLSEHHRVRTVATANTETRNPAPNGSSSHRHPDSGPQCLVPLSPAEPLSVDSAHRSANEGTARQDSARAGPAGVVHDGAVTSKGKDYQPPSGSIDSSSVSVFAKAAHKYPFPDTNSAPLSIPGTSTVLESVTDSAAESQNSIETDKAPVVVSNASKDESTTIARVTAPATQHLRMPSGVLQPRGDSLASLMMKSGLATGREKKKEERPRSVAKETGTPSASQSSMKDDDVEDDTSEADMMEVDDLDGDVILPVVPNEVWTNIFRFSSNDALLWGQAAASSGVNASPSATPVQASRTPSPQTEASVSTLSRAVEPSASSKPSVPSPGVVQASASPMRTAPLSSPLCDYRYATPLRDRSASSTLTPLSSSRDSSPEIPLAESASRKHHLSPFSKTNKKPRHSQNVLSTATSSHSIPKPAFKNSIPLILAEDSIIHRREELTDAEMKDFVVYLAVNWDLNVQALQGKCELYRCFITAGMHDADYLRRHYLTRYRDYRARILKLKRDVGGHLTYGGATTRCAGCKGTTPALSAVPRAKDNLLYCKNCLSASVQLEGIDGGLVAYLAARRKMVQEFEQKML